MVTEVQKQSSVREMVSDDEWKARCDLAALYRLVHMHGWDDLFFSHISLRVPGPDEHFLINPFGYMFEDVTASNLVKVDLEGTVLPPIQFGINPAGFIIHSAIHRVRKDVMCAIHLHTDAGIAIAAQKDGLLPISQFAMNVMSDVVYHEYEGIAIEEDEQKRLAADLGDKHIMILRNHGTMSVGSHPFNAYLRIYLLERACRAQVMAQSGGATLIAHDKAMQDRVFTQGQEGVVNEFFMEIAWAALRSRVDRESPGYAL